jgi:hypothetical protein
MERQRPPVGNEAHLPALSGLGRLGRADAGQGDAAALERQHERGRFDAPGNSILHLVDGQPDDVEIEVVGVAYALEEESQIAPALDGEAVPFPPRAEQADELQMEDLDSLAVGKRDGVMNTRSGHPLPDRELLNGRRRAVARLTASSASLRFSLARATAEP